MLYPHDGDAQLVLDAKDMAGEVFALLAVEAGRGLIEQQHLGLEGERPGEADDLLPAEAERADGLIAITLELDEFEDPLRRLALRALLGARRRQEKRLPNEAGREPRVPTDEEIVEHA